MNVQKLPLTATNSVLNFLELKESIIKENHEHQIAVKTLRNREQELRYDEVLAEMQEAQAQAKQRQLRLELELTEAQAQKEKLVRELPAQKERLQLAGCTHNSDAR